MVRQKYPKNFPIREKFKYFASEYAKRVAKNKVWTMTTMFAIMLVFFLSPHAIYPSTGALPGRFICHDYRHDYEGDCPYLNVNCLHVSQPINIEIYKTLKRDFISYTPACINCGDE